MKCSSPGRKRSLVLIASRSYDRAAALAPKGIIIAPQPMSLPADPMHAQTATSALRPATLVTLVVIALLFPAAASAQVRRPPQRDSFAPDRIVISVQASSPNQIATIAELAGARGAGEAIATEAGVQAGSPGCATRLHHVSSSNPSAHCGWLAAKRIRRAQAFFCGPTPDRDW